MRRAPSIRLSALFAGLAVSLAACSREPPTGAHAVEPATPAPSAVATVALVDVAASATALPKPRSPQKSSGPLLPSGKYVLAYGLQAEHSCSQSFEEHSAIGELTLEVQGDKVSLRLDDRFTHSDGPSPGRYMQQPGAGGFQHDEHERHMSFAGTQVGDGDHVALNLEGGLSLACTMGDVELSPPVDPKTGAEAPHGRVLKGFRCTDASKLFDPEYDRFSRSGGTLSFAGKTKLWLSGHDMGMGSAWVRLETAP